MRSTNVFNSDVIISQVWNPDVWFLFRVQCWSRVIVPVHGR